MDLVAGGAWSHKAWLLGHLGLRSRLMRASAGAQFFCGSSIYAPRGDAERFRVGRRSIPLRM